jgi:hypothetical protein
MRLLRARETKGVGIAAAVALLSACVAGDGDHHDVVPQDDGVGVLRSAVDLSDLDAGCSTSGTEGISAQLLDEMLCLTEGRFVRFSHPNITLTSSRVHPYLSPAAKRGIEAAADSTSIRINSAFRTLAEQYVLWLGCPVAAEPGSSNHESGKAVDVDNYSSARSALLANGFDQPLPGSDPVHFEGPGEDLRSFSVLAFQRLWNANHPGDRIDEDGICGPQTRGRLERSPAEGFAVGRVCGVGPPPLDAELVEQGSDAAESPGGEADYVVCAGDPVSFWVELRNTGGAVWTDSGGGDAEGQAVRLGVPSDVADPFVGTHRVSVADSSNPEVRPEAADPPGGDCTDPGCRRTVFTLAGAAPGAPGLVVSTWRLVDEGRAWFGPEAVFRVMVEDCPEPEPDGGTVPDGGDADLDADEWPDGDVDQPAPDAGPDAAVEDASGPDPHRRPSSPMSGGCGAAGGPAPSLIGAVILSLLP